MTLRKSLSIASWNVNKLISKCCNKAQDDIFLSSINKNDIIGLLETKCDFSNVNFENYIVHHIKRLKSRSQKQDYGGIAILIHKSIKRGVKYLPNTCSEFQWLILDKSYFGYEKNVYVCFCYLPPVN